MAGSIPDACYIGYGNADYQGAGAAEDKDSDGQLQVTGNQPYQQTQSKDSRSIVFCKTVDEALCF